MAEPGGAPDQARPSELSMREPSAMGPTPSVPGREPSAREPSMAEPGGAPDQMREPSGMGPVPSVPGNFSFHLISQNQAHFLLLLP